MKILIGIPCLFNPVCTQLAIESVIGKCDETLIIDNGAEDSVKNIIALYEKKATVIHLEKNIYVTPVWNLIMAYFLESNHDCLVIMNSDLVMQEDWSKVLRRFLHLFPELIPIPALDSDKEITFENDFTVVNEGTPGIFICLSKEHAKIVYPIPDYLKLWFNDNWIYEILRAKYKTVIVHDLHATHHHSQSVSVLPEASELIEQDKKMWAEFGVKDRDKIIAKL